MTLSDTESRVKIADIVPSEYNDFLIYCKFSDKTFLDEISNIDYIAYRSQFGHGKDEVKRLRLLMDEAVSKSGKEEPADKAMPADKDTDKNSLDDRETSAENPTDKAVCDDKNTQAKKVPFLRRVIAKEVEDTYADIFGVNADDYKDVEITNGSRSEFSTSLSVRSLNVLNRGGCFTLEKLLQKTPKELYGMKNLGAKSVREIENALSTFSYYLPKTAEEEQHVKTMNLNVRKRVVRTVIYAFLRGEEYSKDRLTESEKIYFDTFVDAADRAGKSFCINLLDKDKREYIKCAVDELMKYRKRTEYERCIISNSAAAARNWNDEIRSKRIMPFMRLCRAPKWRKFLKEFEAYISPDTRVSQYAELVEALLRHSGNSVHAFEAGLHIFEKWMAGVDINEECTRLFANSKLLDTRSMETLRERMRGATLAEVAQRHGVTRERVRQIEKKCTLNIADMICASKYNIFGLISAYRDGDCVLQMDDVIEAVGEKYGSILWYCAPKMALEAQENQRKQLIARYNEDFDVIIIFGEDSGENAKIIKETISALPRIIETAKLREALHESAEQTGIYEKLYVIEAEKQYMELGTYSSKGSVTIIQMCDILLQKRFPNGYKIADETDGERIVRYMREFFGRDAWSTPHAIDTKIMDIGVQIDRGKYIHRDYINVDSGVIDAITEYVETSRKSAITYMEIYTALKDKFKGTAITNRYALQGVMKLTGCPYVSHRDYIVKTGTNSSSDELNAFVMAEGLVHKSDIFVEFPGWKDSNLAMLLSRCPEIISIGDGMYIHASTLNITDDDRRRLQKCLDANISDVPVHTRYLQDVIMNTMPEFMIENDIQDYEKLFGVLKYMFSDEYHFSHNYISKDVENMTNRSVILKMLEDTDTISIDDIIDMCNRRYIRYMGVPYLLDMIAPDFLRIDKSYVMRREKTGITEEIYADIAAAVNDDAASHGGYISAVNIKDFGWYPQLNIPWTPFVLESAADIIPEGIDKVKLQMLSSDVPRTAFVCGEYAGCDWQTLLLRALKTEHAAAPFKNKAEAHKWLRSEGLCGAKFPAFLDTENHIFTDEYGKLRIE